jgi:hypothetical protein
VRASITITQSDMETAIKEYVQRQGWVVDGRVQLSHDTDNDRGMSSTSYSATMSVSPGRPT